MTTSPFAIDARLRDIRSTRQRCAASLRQVLAGLPSAVSPEDRKRALEVERAAVTAALEALLVPAVIPDPPMNAIEKEQWFAAMASLREGDLPPQRERNRSIVPRVKPAAEPAPEPAAPDPEPAAPAAPPLTGWRLSRARRLGLVTA